MGLNDNHRRALLSTLSHVDSLLATVEAQAADSRSSFSTIFSDLSPAERRYVVAQVSVIRGRMESALREFGIQIPRPVTSASWSIRTALSFAQISLAEAAPSRLRGYGVLDDAAAALVERIEADLGRSFKRFEVWLARRAARDLGTRIERLSSVPYDVQILRTLEDIVSTHGLVEFQAALESIVERLEADTVEVAFFGRVSSGKSSLLNALLGQAILPVGVTPVTAVPTRIELGARSETVIQFINAEDEVISVDRLPEFVSEHGNPNNAKQVVRAIVRISSPRLPRGLVLVDTPGIGALATSGARESYHYLPRCDLGVILVDAGGSLAMDDVDLVRLILESGITPVVLISKVDLVSERERQVLMEYVRAELRAGLGTDVPIYLMSTVGPVAMLATEWFDRYLAPLAARAKESALASAGRKLQAVREGVAASLRVAAGIREDSPSSSSIASADAQRADEVARSAESLIREAGIRLTRLAAGAREIMNPAIATAAAELARQLEEESRQAGVVIRDALVEAAREVRSHCRDEATGLRDRLRELIGALHPGHTGLFGDSITIDLVTIPELIVPFRVDEIELRVRGWARWSLSLRRQGLERDIRDQFGVQLDDSVRLFANALRDWSRRLLDRLAEQVAAETELCRVAPGTRIADANEALAALRRLERLEPTISFDEKRGRGC